MSEDQWQRGWLNLHDEARSLRARIGQINRRLAVECGEKAGRTAGYATQAEAYQKTVRRQTLQARLDEVQAQIDAERVSVCRGGRGLFRARQNLEAAELTEPQWRERWQAERLFITADGEKDKTWGNETIRWHPEQHWLEIRLPTPLAHLANRPNCRYRLSCPVVFNHRGDELAAQAAAGAVRYDITLNPDRGRWYLDASWSTPVVSVPSLEELQAQPTVAVDVNAGHLDVGVLDRHGNPVGAARTIPLESAGLPAETRDGRLRQAITDILALAEQAGARAVVIEDLNFTDARELGRENHGRRPQRGARGRRFRGQVAGIPTGKFRDRLVCMAGNADLFVIAVDPAYTSKWGREHWLTPLQQQTSTASVHHAAALVIGRRGQGHRAKRRVKRNPAVPEDTARVNPSTRPHTPGRTPRNPTRSSGDRRPRPPGRVTPAGAPPPSHGSRRPNTVRGRPLKRDSIPLSV